MTTATECAAGSLKRTYPVIKQDKTEGNFLTRTVTWFRKPGEYENLRTILVAVSIIFLCATGVGVILVVAGVKEWKHQNQMTAAQAEKAKKAELAKQAQNKTKAEELAKQKELARQVEEQRKAEEKRKAEELAKQAEEKRKAEELAKQAETERKKNEAMKLIKEWEIQKNTLEKNLAKSTEIIKGFSDLKLNSCTLEKTKKDLEIDMKIVNELMSNEIFERLDVMQAAIDKMKAAQEPLIKILTDENKRLEDSKLAQHKAQEKENSKITDQKSKYLSYSQNQVNLRFFKEMNGPYNQLNVNNLDRSLTNAFAAEKLTDSKEKTPKKSSISASFNKTQNSSFSSSITDYFRDYVIDDVNSKGNKTTDNIISPTKTNF